MLMAGCACLCEREHKSSSAHRPATMPTTRAVRIPHNFGRWEPEVAAFEVVDRANPPAKGAVLFIGSSTIRMWRTLGEDFPNHKIINRGFGGSEIADATYFAERIIFPYEPKQIFLRAGGNDIHAGRLPEEVAADFAEFVEKVQGKLPRTEIIFISQCPAPARWGEVDKNRELNRMVRKMAMKMPRVSYVDTWDMSLRNDGKAREELFIADKLHFNGEGYKLLAERVRPYLPVVTK
jgi:lysophospholipase L1-like esterase